MSVVTQTPTKLRSSSMTMNKTNSSCPQPVEEKIDAHNNSPTLKLNGLQSESIWKNQYLPALKVAGWRLSLPPDTVKGSGSRQFNIPIMLQTLDDL